MIGDCAFGALFYNPNHNQPVQAEAGHDEPSQVGEESCWQCGGEGNLGSACFDDLCHGGHDVPCFHGDPCTIPCDICNGTGVL